MKVIVGLGNPGKAYGNTRHNVGFAVVDALAEARQAGFNVRLCRSLVARICMSDQEVVLIKPLTFMNLSGEAVACMLDRTDTEPPDLLVIGDDVNLPFGTLRIRACGGDGGHKGLRSIILHLATEEFPRLRVGVGSGEMPEEDLTDFVLDDFSDDEINELPNVVERCCRAVETVVANGISQAMNEFN